MFRKLAVGLLVVALAGTAQARETEPRTVRSERSLRPSQGVVIFSLRSQQQLQGNLHVWFEAADEVARSHADHIRFERKQGVPLLGTNMVDSRPQAFAVPAGRWRLLAHTTKCDQLPPPGTRCAVIGGIGSEGTYPTGRYDGSSIILDVRPREVLNAGELILEFPLGTDLTASFESLSRMGDSMRLRWRVLPQEAVSTLAAPFASLPAAQLQDVVEQSNVFCENREAKLHLGMTVPFRCD